MIYLARAEVTAEAVMRCGNMSGQLGTMSACDAARGMHAPELGE
jgi:hypothetical protein